MDALGPASALPLRTSPTSLRNSSHLVRTSALFIHCPPRAPMIIPPTSHNTLSHARGGLLAWLDRRPNENAVRRRRYREAGLQVRPKTSSLQGQWRASPASAPF